MQSVFFLLLFMISVPGAQAQKDINGTWQGKLSVAGTSLRLVIHLEKSEGQYKASMDSPDQGTKGIPVSSVNLQDDSLFLEVAVARARLTGRFTSDSTFSGLWHQGASLPIEMRKRLANEPTAEPKRPQTPKPPYPYQSTDVVYHNKDKSITYGATITRPNGKGPFPALLLLTGSGAQNRDEELFGHKPFAVIADYLTRKGYLILRADDRGVGQTTGQHQTATTADFAKDAMAGLDYLKSLPDVDKTKIGLAGHSEGGMIAQMVAAQRKEINFVILLASPGEPIIDLMVGQNKALLLSSGLSKEAADQYLVLYRSIATLYAFDTTGGPTVDTVRQLVDDWMKNTSREVVIATTGMGNEADKEKFVTAIAQSFGTPWFRHFLRYDPATNVSMLKAKVLALNGDKDIQVIAATNLPALQKALQKSGSKKFDIIELKGLNHLFQRCNTCTVNEYAQLEETIAPEALETIGNWLEKNVKPVIEQKNK